MGRTSIFNQAENELILEWMQRNPNHTKNSYKKLSKELAKISSTEKTSKQIRQHWSNNLNPDLCKDPLNEDEKNFIVQCADQSNQMKNFPITKIVGLIQQKFNKLYSENTIKNFLHTRKRRLDRIQELPKLKVYEPKPSPPKFNVPPMNPIFD
ncbi:8111_t:CDS:2 [Funneliformis caledonium]|uniref:8111_t:CDS:1 n=1 Tax=Funneliformis caledonium TaxID=1117310 RepID=A0A9N9FE69_9GLOM|nr:8111_t:CDS:2 [Funneliformis caledonium]